MVRANGLRSWHVEVRGDGRRKSHRYHYEHNLNMQLELPIEPKATGLPLELKAAG